MLSVRVHSQTLVAITCHIPHGLLLFFQYVMAETIDDGVVAISVSCCGVVIVIAVDTRNVVMHKTL